jgi:hypothetical protein
MPKLFTAVIKVFDATCWHRREPRLLFISVDVVEGKAVAFDSYHTKAQERNKEPEFGWTLSTTNMWNSYPYTDGQLRGKLTLQCN